MTCFWDGMLASLTGDDRQRLGMNPSRRGTVQQLIQCLKHANCETKAMQWQGVMLRSQELKQNVEHVNAYDARTANQGYLCSTCDPFLALLSYLIKKKIRLNYCGHIIEFAPCDATDAAKTYCYKCNRGHFWFEGKR